MSRSNKPRYQVRVKQKRAIKKKQGNSKKQFLPSQPKPIVYQDDTGLWPPMRMAVVTRHPPTDFKVKP